MVSSHTVRRAVGQALILTLTLGSAGASAAAQCDGCFAFVDANGSLGRSRGVASAAKLADGRYEVVFTSLVTKCAFTAPIGVSVATAPGPVQPAMVAAGEDRGGAPSTGVIVQTFNSGSVPSDQPFFLMLTCLPN